MSKLVVVGVIIILISLFGFVILSNKQPDPESFSSLPNSPMAVEEVMQTPRTDTEASFAIFTNGTFRLFSDSMYHNLSQDAYIEVINPNIVQVKKLGTTWNDFFATLPFKLTTECLITGTKQTFCTGNGGELQFYLNGVKNDTALNQEIKDGDKLLITFGSESDAQIQQQIERIP